MMSKKKILIDRIHQALDPRPVHLVFWQKQLLNMISPYDKDNTPHDVADDVYHHKGADLTLNQCLSIPAKHRIFVIHRLVKVI